MPKTSDSEDLADAAEKWRAFDQVLLEVREQFADLSPDELGLLVEEALRDCRQQKE